jgi:hypothetical protein
MELGHLLTRSGFTYPQVSSKASHDSFCLLGSSVSLPWVIYVEEFYLHVVSSFSCIPVIIGFIIRMYDDARSSECQILHTVGEKQTLYKHNDWSWHLFISSVALVSSGLYWIKANADEEDKSWNTDVSLEVRRSTSGLKYSFCVCPTNQY